MYVRHKWGIGGAYLGQQLRKGCGNATKGVAHCDKRWSGEGPGAATIFPLPVYPCQADRTPAGKGDRSNARMPGSRAGDESTPSIISKISAKLL